MTDSEIGDGRAFLIALAFGCVMAPAAFGISHLLSIDLLPLLRPSLASALAGVAATAPLVAGLLWFMRTNWRPLAEFRRSQVKFFSEIGFRLTPVRGILLAIVAGVGEELLFRGVLQTEASKHFPIGIAIALPSVAFGALHARTALYAFIAGLVGAYLGVLFWVTGSLFSAIVTHALYDIAAFEMTRRAIAAAGPNGDFR